MERIPSPGTNFTRSWVSRWKNYINMPPHQIAITQMLSFISTGLQPGDLSARRTSSRFNGFSPRTGSR
jgi:hypothetical protein